MADLIRRSEQGKFVGRREEQKVFREAVQRMIQLHRGRISQDEALFKHVFLLQGEGGMGKTTLLDRLTEICSEETGNDLIVIKVDWDDYKNQSISGTMDVMDIIYGHISSDFEKKIRPYREAREQREHVRRKADDARKEFDSLAAVAGEIGSIATGTGSVGKSVIQEAIHTGARVVAEIRDRRNEWIQQKLTPQEFTLYKNLQLEMSRAFVSSLAAIAEHKPLVLMFDTYEHIDRDCNGWVRDGLILHGSDRIIYVIAGRNDHTAFYRDRLPQELLQSNTVESFSRLDIEDYLRAWDIPISENLVDTVTKISRGVPLAVKAIAGILITQKDIQNIFGDLAEKPLLRKEEIVKEVTCRFLRYCLDTNEDNPEARSKKIRDRFRIYTLALIRQHTDRAYRDYMLKAIWSKYEKDVSEQGIDEILQELTERYSFMFGSFADMHPTVKEFIAMALRDQSIPRGAMLEINTQAYVFAAEKMETISGSTEDLYRRKDYQEYCLDCLNHLLWINQYDAIRFLANHFIKAMWANRRFSEELLKVISEDAREHLSDEHTQVIWALENIATWTGGTAEQIVIANRIQGLLSEWLDRETEILRQLLNVKNAVSKGRKGIQQALEHFGEAKKLCQSPDEMGKMRSETAVIIAEALPNIGHAQTAILLLQEAIKMNPSNPQAHLLLGKLLFRRGEIDRAVNVYEKAISIGINGTYIKQELKKINNLVLKLERGENLQKKTNRIRISRALVISGNILVNEGLLENAAKKYLSALSADPEYAQARIKLGHCLRQLGRFWEAEENFRRAQKSRSKFIQALAYDGLGAVNRQNGDIDYAEILYKQAIELSSDYANAYNGLGKIYCLQRQLEDAYDCFRSVLKHKPDAYWTFNNHGITLLLANRHDEATSRFRKAARLCRDSISRGSRAYLSLFSLGIALFGQGEYTEGLLALRQATSICTARGLVGEVISDLQLIELQTSSERIREAISYLKEVTSNQ